MINPLRTAATKLSLISRRANRTVRSSQKLVAMDGATREKLRVYDKATRESRRRHNALLISSRTGRGHGRPIPSPADNNAGTTDYTAQTHATRGALRHQVSVHVCQRTAADGVARTGRTEEPQSIRGRSLGRRQVACWKEGREGIPRLVLAQAIRPRCTTEEGERLPAHVGRWGFTRTISKQLTPGALGCAAGSPQGHICMRAP